ncbi:hypothetical protein T552_02708 [Pneumocystis carinii B80]|uniref:Sacsin/Nov domain-containing protein n=1 Tax=Pneumocystis carinii (strain B80) TaxID=1408658 RepID=A0A0W4ZEC7_PNEC8|nr:hypothetical protein T552_02708 [Pneumocystis carinii B80]KTW26702.1 hypothetical protein T552_02708 [Pneumocystis carinii B80]
MDIGAYKRLTLGEMGRESSVTVNQRALIGKETRFWHDMHRNVCLWVFLQENDILDTLFRELLQNSDDACSRHVEIHYQTLDDALEYDDMSQITKRLCRQLVFKNDGVIFREEDWQRISRIAEGNPDEEKIGAFGVGFYSVFSICEDPFVMSGDQTMVFYWKNDQLYVKRAVINAEVPMTTFLLQMREPMEMPYIADLSRFLTTCFSFTRNLLSISLYFDGFKLVTLSKSKELSQSIPIPKDLILISPQKIMRIDSVAIESLKIRATYLNFVCSHSKRSGKSILRLKWVDKFNPFNHDTHEDMDPNLEVTSDITLRLILVMLFFRIASAMIQVSISPSYRKELERITKKKPPKSTRVQLLYSDHLGSNVTSRSKIFFSDLLTCHKQGNVYIGFSTHQTTGFGAHLGASALIPTVERENIDLVDKFVKYWNNEILYCFGILSRIIYHYEIQRIVDHFQDDIKTPFIYIMNMFTMEASTPLPISNIIEEAFFSCSKSYSVPLIIDKVISSDKIYLPDSNIDFLPEMPFISHDVLLESSKFFDKLKYMDMIKQISSDDIYNELSKTALTIKNTVSFIKWLNKKSNIDYIMRLKLIGAVVIFDEHLGTISLSYLRCYLDTKLIPSDMPLPPTCAPYILTKNLSPSELEILDWKELSILEWLQYICLSSISLTKNDINHSPQFALRVLETVSKSWEEIDYADRNDIIMLLNSKTCMPTKNHGMRIPSETYFHTVTLFSDLSVIEPMTGIKEAFLSDLGVRKTVEYQVIFDRLIGGGEWSHIDLICYLASSKDCSIPSSDFEKLKKTSICKIEGDSKQTYRVCELYEPIDSLRALSLPIIQWPQNKWNPSSNEALLLFSLGLKRFPSSEVLVNLAASGPSELREKALSFFIANYYTYDYKSTYSFSESKLKFLPVQDNNKQSNLESPTTCFTNKFCCVFGFRILRYDLIPEAKKFGVQNDPNIDDVVSVLVKSPPNTIGLARAQFEYLASRLGEFKRPVLDKLNKVKFIPTQKHNGNEIRHLSPDLCFIQEEDSVFYNQIFDFVDFGHKANVFLKACGTLSQPSFPQLAELLLKNPKHIFDLVKTPEKYQDILRKLVISSYFHKKTKDIFRDMENKPFLLASRKRKNKMIGNKMFSENQETVEYLLSDASSIFIVDDVVSYNLFSEFILAAPQEDILEEFYQSLGSKRLSSVVREEYKFKGPKKENSDSYALRKLFIDRCGLFLHETSTVLLRNIDWLASKLNVAYLEDIKLQRILKFKNIDHSYEHSVTCALDPEFECSIYLTKNWDSYDVAQVLCKILLEKPAIHDPLLLSSLIATDLNVLQQRGYNVQRILYSQDLKKKKEEEIQKINLKQHEIEKEMEKYSADSELQNISSIKYPGSYPFEDFKDNSSNYDLSLDKNETSSLMKKKPEFLEKNNSKDFKMLSKFQKLYGYQNNHEKQHKDFLYENVSLLKNFFMKKVKLRNNMHIKRPVDYEQSVVSNLHQAIKACRNNNELSVCSPIEIVDVKEAKDGYCNISHSHDLKFVNRTTDNINVYVSKDIHSGESFIMNNKSNIDLFSSLILKKISTVFGFNTSVLNIFYDDDGPAIAFNKNGSIFCNLRHYILLHSKKLISGNSKDVLAFWFVTIAHELSHNIVSEHGHVHSFYTYVYK